MNYDQIIILGISFGLGMLVGMQRETTNNRMAGVRTFTLITILGSLTGFIAQEFESPIIIAAIAVVLAAFLIMANVIKLKKLPDPDVGQTTEVAAILMYSIGVYLVFGDKIIGVMVGGVLAILLFVKEHLHGFIEKLKEKDLSAIMTFVGISLVILPILPDETFGPFDVLNPKNIWLMVVLIVGISVFGYFIYKWLGKKAGLISNGILGGIISSTASTVSFARKSKKSNSSGKLAAFVILLAVTVSLVRVLIEIMVVIPGKFQEIITPIMVLFVFMLMLSVVLFYLISKDRKDEELPEPKNPAQFKSALVFAAIYAAILLIVAYTEKEFGNDGLYIASAIGGLANKDAITLSLSKMIGGGVETSLGWRLIMTAIISNLFFKVVMVSVLGNKNLTKWISLFMLISIAFGVGLILLWPDNWHF
ncbi:MgtC/SapB family protein [Mesonia sp. K7]|uniref:MgtC/SapB family protein n=1 Tax=Mesonia sp. K7 TaxID=2218606 RepID=UPI000DA97254|nr:MgtC/SapB family protein [Mesonia sp. K7]PZD78633.1 MgtC/SapB family protein [Mesonia sp. K7]